MKNVHSDGQQFHQYQQNERLHLIYGCIPTNLLQTCFRLVRTTLYLTLCTFPLKLTKVARLLQDVVSPQCGDKRMARRCTRRSLPNYFVMTSHHWNLGEKHIYVSNVHSIVQIC
jgi:hypothetical protein